MKKQALYFIAVLISFFSVVTMYSQTVPASADSSLYPYWIQMMQDPDIPFHATVSAFEKYWNNRTVAKGDGWKVFKRWEYINGSRVGADGKLPRPGSVAEEHLRSASGQRSVSGTWTQLGPVNFPSNSTGQPTGMGRVNAIGFHPTDANTYYIGSPSGGLWRTTTGGTSWTNLSAGMPTLGVSAVVVHPSTPGTIWIGTGDRDGGDAPGMGVYKSTDIGNTWVASNTGMGNLTVGMMATSPGNPDILLAATSGGIYKSTNAGVNWSRKSPNTSSYKDLRYKPGDPSIIYATSGGSFYRSSDAGETWTVITSGVISGSRLVIGVTPADPSIVYLVQTNGTFSGLLKSTDSGLNFTTFCTSPNIMDYACDGSGTSNQSWYDLCIAVDPANPNVLYTGGINIWKSTNGGTSLSICSHWVGSSWGTSCAPSVHADIHCLDFSPVNGSLYTGCDGGIYVTSNGGTSWADISAGLAIAQVYKIGQSATSSGHTMNGYQDNGTALSNNSAFTTVIGGDGMECIIDYSNLSYKYGALYYGDIRRSSGGGFSTIAKNGVNGITESGGWVTPYILHETDPNTMFAGYKNVWRSTNVKASTPSWTAISASEASNCIVLEQSTANVNILYVVRSGQLKRSDNANDASVTWTSCSLPGGYTPTDLEAHPTNADIIYATAAYGVYKSTDRGLTWTNISGNLPSIYTNCLVFDKNSNEGIYVGNETSVYYKDNTLSEWVSFSSGLPIVDIRELEIYYDATNLAESRIKAATYGRGLWVSDLMETGVINPTGISAVPSSDTQINLGWTKNANNNNVLVAFSASNTFGVPVQGTNYQAGNSITGGGTVLYSGGNSGFTHTALTPGTTYYYKIWSYNAGYTFSYGAIANATTLAAPTAGFSVSNATPALGSTITFTDQSQFAPTSWNWTITPGTYTFMNGTTSGSQNPQVKFDALGNYSVTLQASNAWGSDDEIKTDYVNVIPLDYCTPVYTSGTGYGDYISLVQLGSINNLTGASSSPYYTYFNTLSTDLSKMSAYTITVSAGTYASANNISVWIDYDHDGAFSANEKLGNVTLTAAPATGTINFVVPETAMTGITRMRVREVWNTTTFDACSGYGYGETEDYNVNVTTSEKVLNLTVFMEGLFNGTGLNQAQNATGNQFPGIIADQITIELHQSTSPYYLAAEPYTINLTTSGNASITYPYLNSGSYYIVVKHRNSIETWSSQPVSFSSSGIAYNFTDAATRAFGSNLKLVSGNFVIYGGDINQDGLVDSGDMIPVDNDVSNFTTGYISTDINGDGLIDSGDMILLDNNSAAFIAKNTP